MEKDVKQYPHELFADTLQLITPLAGDNRKIFDLSGFILHYQKLIKLKLCKRVGCLVWIG